MFHCSQATSLFFPHHFSLFTRTPPQGVPLTTDWTLYNTSARNMTCPEKCVAAGHCCVGTVSSFDHPSCEQGCLVGARAKTEAECEQVCHDADKKCGYTYKDIKLQMCDSCPKHCDASVRWQILFCVLCGSTPETIHVRYPKLPVLAPVIHINETVQIILS